MSSQAEAFDSALLKRWKYLATGEGCSEMSASEVTAAMQRLGRPGDCTEELATLVDKAVELRVAIADGGGEHLSGAMVSVINRRVAAAGQRVEDIESDRMSRARNSMKLKFKGREVPDLDMTEDDAATA